MGRVFKVLYFVIIIGLYGYSIFFKNKAEWIQNIVLAVHIFYTLLLFILGIKCWFVGDTKNLTYHVFERYKQETGLEQPNYHSKGYRDFMGWLFNHQSKDKYMIKYEECSIIWETSMSFLNRIWIFFMVITAIYQTICYFA